MANNDTLSMVLELKDKFSEQIKSASKDTEKLAEAIQALNVDLKKLSADQIKKNIDKNVSDATKALYNLMDAKEKLDKAMSRNTAMRADGFLGIDESRLNSISSRLDDIINRLMNIGAEANFSKSAVRDMLAALNSDVVLKDAKKVVSSTDKGLDKQLKEHERALKSAAKEQAAAEKEAADAAKANAKNQEMVKDALSRIATARAKLSAASDSASAQDQMHARLLMSLLDQLAHKLNGLKGTFLGERGVLDGVLGSGYRGLMRNVDIAARDALNGGGVSDAAWEAMKREANAHSEASAAAERHKQKLAELNDAFEKQARAEERANARLNAHYQSQQKASQATRQRAEELVRLRMEMLRTQAAELQGVMKNGRGVLDPQKYAEVRDALRAVREEMRQLEGVMQRMGSYSTRDLLGFGRGHTQDFSPLVKYANDAIAASHAVNQLTDSERKFVEGIVQATNGLHNQGVVLRDLQMLATQYLSIWGARSYINKIIETGGLLEQQRLSIAAILGSMDKANVVFGKIKDLAVKSPFGVVELDKMSKQLTAYGFQYEELFDWTKRLADISAATGTEVSRLALALGHVRAEGALSGYTLRQFAMANVPLLQNLANNLGITTKQVREKTKKKEIGYDEVKKVLEDLTSEGGMFYNAQEVMSQALNAKFKNLRDAFDIMYGEIAESGVGDILKGIAETLTAGAKEWKRYGTDILWVAAAFGIAKTASIAFTAGMTTLTKQMGFLAFNTRAYTAEQLKQLASDKLITREQLLRAVATGRLSVEQARLAGATLGVSEATLRQAASTGVVTKAMLGNAMATSRFSVAQLRLIATLKAQGAAFPILTVALQGVAAGFRAVGAAIRSFLPFLAIGAIVDIFARSSQQSSAAKDMAEETAAALSVSASNIKQAYEAMKPPKDTKEMADAVENMKEVLQDNGAYSSIKAQVEGTEDLNEQYDILCQRMKEISNEYLTMKYNMQAYIEEALKAGGGLLSDNLGKDLKQYSDATIRKNAAKTIADQYAPFIIKEILSALSEEDAWEYLTGKMGDVKWDDLINRNGVKEDMINRLFLNTWKSGMPEEAAEALKEYLKALKEAYETETEVNNEMPTLVSRIQTALSEEFRVRGLDMQNIIGWDDDDIENYAKELNNAIAGLKLSKEAGDHVKQEILKTLPKEVQMKIEAIPDKKPEKMEQWLEDLKKYFEDNNIKLFLTVDDNIETVAKKLQEARKKAQERMNNAGAILTYWKIEPDMSAVEEFAKNHPLLGSLIKAVFSEYTSGKEEVENIDKAHEDTGIPVIDPTKNKGNKTDEQLKKWKEEWNELKSFYSEFRKWAKEIGDDAALQKLRETGLWGQFFKSDGTPMYDMKSWEEAIKQFRSKLSGGSTEREQFIFSVGKEMLTPQYDQMKEAADAMLKQLDEELKKQGKQWNLYKKIFEATGSREQASQIAFGGIVDFSNQVEQLRAELEKEIAGRGLSIDALLGMDEKTLADNNIPANSRIARLLKELKEASEQVKAEEVEKMVDATKKLAGIEEQIAVVENKLADARKDYGENSVQALALEKELAELRMKQLEESEPYLRFYSAIMNMTIEEAEAAGAAIKENLVKQLADGAINADKYLKSIKNVDTQLQKIRGKKGLFTAFMTGGVKGVLSAKGEVVDAEAADAAIVLQMTEKELLKARHELEIATKNGTAEERIAAAGRVKGLEIQREQDEQNLKEIQEKQNLLGLNAKQVESWNQVLTVMDKVLGTIDGVAKAFDQLSEMFDALGQEGRAAGWSDAADTLRAIASPFQSASNAAKSALSGDIGGTIAGTVGIVTAPVTAFAQLHDKRRERRLQESQKLVKELTIDYQNLQKAMESALGGIYTSGGYGEMLSDLNVQRAEIQSQYDIERSKKKSDGERLADYQQQLREMDEQIKNFALDMAKSLYDIDLQGWASELTSAVVGAWEAGEDAAEAYRNKVGDLMKDIVQNILTKKVMERAFANLGIDRLIESEMISSNGKLNEGVIPRLAEKLYQAGELTTGAITQTLDQLESAGYINKDEKAKSSSAGSGIKGVTEQTADLLAGYINAIRADVSVNRVTLQQILIAVQVQSAMPVIARAQLTQLEQIAGNTNRNANAADAIYTLLHRLAPDGTSIRVK